MQKEKLKHSFLDDSWIDIERQAGRHKPKKMETGIQIFDSNTIWNRRGKPPVVQISRYGHIRFSVEAVKLLGLKEGMRIAFLVNENDKGVIYFYEQATGMPLRLGMTTKTGTRLELYCRPLSLKLLAFFGFSGNKTFGLQKEKTKVLNADAWLILKDKIHKPIKWRKP